MTTALQVQRGFLASVDLDPQILVEFQFNPSQISDKRAVSYASLNAPGLLMPARQYSQGGDRTLSFTVRVDGLADGSAADAPDPKLRVARDDAGGITPELNKYRAFLYPQTAQWNRARASFVPLFADAPQFASPPIARFGFGEDRVIYCVVTDVSITELLFTPELAPLRADVAVTLVELTPYDDALVR